MRAEWQDLIATQYLWRNFDDSRWRSSAAFELFLAEQVDADVCGRLYPVCGPGVSYEDAFWNDPEYAQLYLGYHTQMYVASLQSALLRLALVDLDRPLRVLDVGIGAGSTFIAILDLLNTCELLGLEPLPAIQIAPLERDQRKLEITRINVRAFARYLAPETSAQAAAIADADAWEVPLDVVGAHEHLTNEFDLLVVGNVLSELESQDGGRPLAAVVENLLPSMVAPDGVALLVQHSFEEDDRHFRSVCGVRRALATEGFDVLGPCTKTSDCVVRRVDDCVCGQTLSYEYPASFLDWSGEASDHRALRSSWSAVRRTGAVVGEGVCAHGLLAPLASLTSTDGLPPFRCPVCEGPTTALRGFYGCSDMCHGIGSVTKNDGTVRLPEGYIAHTRANKIRLARHRAEVRMRERRRAEAAELHEAWLRARSQRQAAMERASDLEDVLLDASIALEQKAKAILATDRAVLREVPTPVLKRLYTSLDGKHPEVKFALLNAFSDHVVRLRPILKPDSRIVAANFLMSCSRGTDAEATLARQLIDELNLEV